MLLPWEAEPPKKGRQKAAVNKEEQQALEDEANEARVWLSGLDYINNCLGASQPGIQMCVDLSATPFYIKGSGYPEGQPFPWLVSDFGLVDAIESGIVKIPRLPVKDTSDKKDEVGRPDPKYFRLWHNIAAGLQPGEKLPSGKPKAEVVYREAEGALKQIAAQWVDRYKLLEQRHARDSAMTPPVLIIVCDNIDLADLFYRKISGESEAEIVTPQDVEDVAAGEDDEDPTKSRKAKPKKQVNFGKGEIFPEFFSNTELAKHTIRIDTKLLQEAESEDPNKTKRDLAVELRRVVATVGKRGEPGEFVRCVVSVAMLTEGWDANNVTQILGVRAFGTQLLCEQVVGRGLRRTDYEPEWDEDEKKLLLRPEYVDVYGIPFTVIPFKGKPVNKPTDDDDKPKFRVWALPDRDSMEMRFPVVEGYVFEMRKGILRCDVAKIEPINIDQKSEPTTTFLRPTAGYLDTQQTGISKFEFVSHTRATYYEQTHFQTILFQITQLVIDHLLGHTMSKTDKKARVLRLVSRHQLFPQVFGFVQAYVETRVKFNGIDRRELGLQRYVELVVERVREAIYPDDSAGEPPLLPLLNRYKPFGSTAGVDFPTTRPCCPATRSHINLVVLHSTWESEAVEILDKSAAVKFHARNDHLGLIIPYDYLGIDHGYEPDFLVRLANDVTLLLEIKGYEVHGQEQTNAKHEAAKRWVRAVSNLGEFGKWDFYVCRDLDDLVPALVRIAAGATIQPGDELPRSAFMLRSK